MLICVTCPFSLRDNHISSVGCLRNNSLVLCLIVEGGGISRGGWKFFQIFIWWGGGDSKMTYRGNPNSPEGNRRGDDPNR